MKCGCGAARIILRSDRLRRSDRLFDRKVLRYRRFDHEVLLFEILRWADPRVISRRADSRTAVQLQIDDEGSDRICAGDG